MNLPGAELSDASFAEDLTRALHLLHSKDPRSADELRELLDAAITRRYGPDRVKSRKHKSSSNEAEASKRPKYRGSFKDSKGCEVSEKDEVPRISIPDEDQTDFAACKVCNVPALGPLVLIQCRRCAESYHPLCHQPPIGENDSKWKCTECLKKVQAKSVKKDVTTGITGSRIKQSNPKKKVVKKNVTVKN